MPQYPLVPRFGGGLSSLVISSPTVLKTEPGTLWSVSVITSGTTSGSVNDCTTSGAATSGNVTVPIPTAVGNGGVVAFPHKTGITVIPGAGQVLSVAYA